MANSQSTTRQPDSVNINPDRRMTVGYVPGAARVGRYPELRFGGRWLQQLGFPIGSKIKMEVSQGRLVIEPIPPGEILKAHALRQLAVAESMLKVADQPSTDLL